MTAPNFDVLRLVLHGAVLTVRAIHPKDRRALRAAFHKLSPESRYRRFQGHISDLSPAMLRYLTEVDGVDHFAVVAVLEQGAHVLPLPSALIERWRGEPEIVGAARMIRLDPTTAEVAVTVADAFHQRGLGSHLMQVLVDRARRSGVDTFVAQILPDNRAMLRLLGSTGALKRLDDGTVTATLAPAPSTSRAPTSIEIDLVVAMRRLSDR